MQFLHKRKQIYQRARLWVEVAMIDVKTWDGIFIHVLPDNAYCGLSEDHISPLDIDECPFGADACFPDICEYYREDN